MVIIIAANISKLNIKRIIIIIPITTDKSPGLLVGLSVASKVSIGSATNIITFQAPDNFCNSMVLTSCRDTGCNISACIK